MKFFGIFTFAGLFLGLSSFVRGVETYSVDQVLYHLEQNETKLQSIQFNFKQQINFTTTGQVSETEGQAVFQKPNKLNVIQNKPQEQITITNGKKTWIYTPAFHQVWVGKGGKSLSSLLPKGMIPFQNVAEELRKNYDLKLMDPTIPDDKEITLGAVPKSKDVGYDLQLVFSSDSWLPKKTIYISSTAKVVTTILNYEMNPSVTAQSFEFNPPPGTDVIPF